MQRKPLPGELDGESTALLTEWKNVIQTPGTRFSEPPKLNPGPISDNKISHKKKKIHEGLLS